VAAAQDDGGPGQQRYQPPPVDEEEEVWTSPADSGWEAAAAATTPNIGGFTAAGLPRRVPKTNLVPGTVGGSSVGQGRHAQHSADEVRGRLSSFHRGTRRGREDGLSGDMPEAAESMPAAVSGVEPGGRTPADGADEQENA
jgi:hypothetical protein